MGATGHLLTVDLQTSAHVWYQLYAALRGGVPDGNVGFRLGDLYIAAFDTVDREVELEVAFRRHAVRIAGDELQEGKKLVEEVMTCGRLRLQPALEARAKEPLSQSLRPGGVFVMFLLLLVGAPILVVVIAEVVQVLRIQRRVDDRRRAQTVHHGSEMATRQAGSLELVRTA